MKTKCLFAIFALIVLFTFAGCDDQATDGGGGPVEYTGGFVDIANSIWDGSVRYNGVQYTVRVNIPNSNTYSFYINNNLDDTGTYVRTNNTATLTSTHGYTSGQIIGTAVLTDPNTMYITNYSNTGRAGSYTVTRRP